MSNLWSTVWVELIKARHSRVLLFSMIAIALVPFIGGFFMVILKDPDMARDLGIISTKAQIVGGEASWATYMSLLAQATAIGGFIIFGFVTSWVFGREYADRTIKDLLALPTPRNTIVSAKFIVIALWSAMLIVLMTVLGLIVGRLVLGTPEAGSPIVNGFTAIGWAVAMTVVLQTPVAFFAVMGQGYLPPMAFAIAAVVAAQIVAAIGWGEYFPWSIPALYSGVAGTQSAQLGIASFVILAVTGLIGLIATYLWLGRADQTR